MHPTILVKRQAVAIDRITWAAGALATQLELDPALVDALQPKGIKDPRVVEMMRLEGVADLMLQLAISAGAVKEGDAVTVVTPGGAPEDQTEPEPILTAIPILPEDDLGPDGLPAPTFEEVLAEQPVSETIEEVAVDQFTEDETETPAAGQPEATEPETTAADESPAEVLEAPIPEEEPEPPAKPKSKSKSRSKK